MSAWLHSNFREISKLRRKKIDEIAFFCKRLVAHHTLIKHGDKGIRAAFQEEGVLQLQLAVCLLHDFNKLFV